MWKYSGFRPLTLEPQSFFIKRKVLQSTRDPATRACWITKLPFEPISHNFLNQFWLHSLYVLAKNVQGLAMLGPNLTKSSLFAHFFKTTYLMFICSIHTLFQHFKPHTV